MLKLVYMPKNKVLTSKREFFSILAHFALSLGKAEEKGYNIGTNTTVFKLF